jgi:hypothetical protein
MASTAPNAIGRMALIVKRGLACGEPELIDAEYTK